ncbi:PREDICTED: GATA zinc finger domain-containing protein 7-like [Brassica oleracea var. oleracea]|uniref:GATA zinc finger domain-containing protein 7-like n=1 Tax=Brassica oleracea var. oleracea TaxID=109376 RepID=UPI0006A6A71A|nr:PREDICTED: GATA zinc finger domain-containing protein 7-like [Brassica oleracea var. oleracea]
MYLLNGLNGKYDNIINVIMHRQPFPTFEEARSMLILEEDRLGKGKKTTATNNESSSSTKVLAVTASTPEHRSSSHGDQQQQQFSNKGRGRNRGRGRHNNNSHRSQFQQWNTPFLHNHTLNKVSSDHDHNNNNGGNQRFEPTTDFASAFNTMTLIDPNDSQWYMDSGATAHLSNTAGSSNTEDSSPQ